MKNYGALKKRWQRVNTFYAHVVQAGACAEWGTNPKKLADLSNKESAFFIFEPEEAKGGRKMRRLNRKGQSTLEYVIILTAIVAAVIIGASYVRGRIEAGFTDVATSIGSSTTRLGEVTP